MDTSISSHAIVDEKAGRAELIVCVCGASAMTFDGKTIEHYAPWPTPCFGPSKGDK